MSRRSITSGDGRGSKMDVRRGEFNRVSDALKDVNNVTRQEFTAATNDILSNIRDLHVQFERIAQIQVEIDDLKRAVAELLARK